MKRTQFGKGSMSARTLRLNGETVKKLTQLNDNQLRQAGGGTGGSRFCVPSLDNFCMEDTVYCPA